MHQGAASDGVKHRIGDNEGDSGRPPTERLFTVSEAAQILGLRPRAVREYVHRGELRGRLIRKRWRFRRNDLAEFLERPPEWELR